ncbi:MAG TPA: FMN-binding negative transcriptional regulator [Orrella sp.]
MYLPKHFVPTDPQAPALIVRHYPLAQVVRLDADGHLACDPIPLLMQGELKAGASLLGHVARANVLWQQQGAVLAIFAGPRAYVTPNAYPGKAEHHRVVPTYNYATVQVSGQLVAHDDPVRTLEIVRLLTEAAETSQPAPWSVDDAPEDFVQANLRAIVGIEIQIESVVTKFKLSQNKSGTDHAGVLDYLAGSAADSDAADMIKLMTDHQKPTSS